MKTKNRFLSALLGLVLMLGLMCGLSVSAMADTEWADLQNAINSASNEAIINVSVYAGADKKIVAPESAGALTIDSGKNITLDLDGCTIDRGLKNSERKENGCVIKVLGTLTVTDSSESKQGTITGGNDNGSDGGGGGVYVNGGQFKLEGGTITGNTSGNGGGVYVDSDGGFNMSGGAITKNKAVASGGGVYMELYESDPKRYIFGGSITGNTARDGGGLYIKPARSPPSPPAARRSPCRPRTTRRPKSGSPSPKIDPRKDANRGLSQTNETTPCFVSISRTRRASGRWSGRA